MAKVRVGSTYIFTAVGLDILYPTDYTPGNGQLVKVVNQPGCPPANTMGQCYVADMDGKFLCMVSGRMSRPAVVGVTQEQVEQLEARGVFSAAFSMEHGWDVNNLSFDQILEIRAQDGWKNPVGK